VAVVTAVQFIFRVTAFGLEELPVAPHTVNRSVMDVESWVAWRGKEVAAGVAVGGEVVRLSFKLSLVAGKVSGDLPDDIVSAAVRADFGRVRNSLEEGAVFGDVGLG